MRFHLEASFRLSADAAVAQEAIAEFFLRAGPIMQKGAPEGHGAKIAQWNASWKQDRSDNRERQVRSCPRCDPASTKTPGRALGQAIIASACAAWM